MANNYTVTGQRPTSILGPTGTFQDVIEISFLTVSGQPGVLRVNASDYRNLDYVKQQLDSLATHMEAVQAL